MGWTAGALGLIPSLSVAGLTQKGFLGEVSFKPNLGKGGLARAKVNCVWRSVSILLRGILRAATELGEGTPCGEHQAPGVRLCTL